LFIPELTVSLYTVALHDAYYLFVDANLQEYENMESMPRPEEDREMEIEKNKRLQQQLKVTFYSLKSILTRVQKGLILFVIQ